MTQEISSLMDGELDPHESERAIRECGTSPAAKQSWETYHVIGEVLRGDSYRRIDIAARVMTLLEGEPTVLAPARAKPRSAHTFGRIALAAAASVATIGVVGWIGTQGMPGATSPQVAQLPPGVTTVMGSSDGAVAQTAATVVPAYAAIEMNDYLAAHRQIPSPDLYRTVASRAPAKAR